MEFSKRAKRLEPQPMFSLSEKVKELDKQGKDFIHFEIGDTDLDCNIITKHAAIDSLVKNQTHYTPSKGIPDLINAICKKYNVQPKNVLITPGANISIFYTLSCLCNKGDIIAIPNPGFPTYSLVAKYLNLNFYYYTEKMRRPEYTKIIIINSPNNPTGKSGSFLFDDNSVDYFYSDNIYFSYNNKIDDHIYDTDRLISAFSFSKMYAMPGFRLGYIIANEELIDKMEILLNITNSCVPEFVQRAGIEALQSDNSAMIEEYRKRRDILVEGLNKIDGITCDMPDGAFYVFPFIKRTGLTSRQFADKMFDAGVALLPGTDFGTNGEGHVRISYASTNIEKIKEGLKRIKEAL